MLPLFNPNHFLLSFSRCQSLSLQLLEELEPRHNHFSLDIPFLHDHGLQFDDEVYRLHLAKAMSKPCYIIACYTTLHKQKVSSVSHKRLNDVRSQSIWRSGSLKNLSSLINPDHNISDPLDDGFRAAPDCRIHSECNDPIFRCFSLARVAKDLASKSPEYREEYTKVAEDTQSFAKDLLSMCKTTSEVDLLLSEPTGSSYFLRNSAQMKYPRLRLAVEINLKEFVGHMYCQQILTQQWVGRTSWIGKSFLVKTFITILQILLTPIFACGHVLKLIVNDIDEALESNNKLVHITVNKMKKMELFVNLESPINRCMSFLLSVFVMMFVLVETVISPVAIDHFSKIDPENIIRLQSHHYILMFMIVAFVFREIEDLMSVRSIWMYFKFDFWRIYRIINQTLIIIALLFQIHLDLSLNKKFTSMNCYHNCTLVDINFGEYEAEITITSSLYSTAATVSCIYFFFWMQLHEKIGPIVIYATNVISDVITVSIMYIIILVAFTSGIIFTLGTERINEQFDKNKLMNGTGLGEEYVINFAKTLETLFWHSLGPGEPHAASQVTVLPKLLMGMYQTISAIIFMNLLVAIMNATVQRIEDKKLLYWKFARTAVWIRFFDEARALPPPFNIINVFRFLWCPVLRLLSRKKKLGMVDFLTETDKKMEQQAKHKELILSLIKRFQDGQKQAEEEASQCTIRDMKEEILEELKNMKHVAL